MLRIAGRQTRCRQTCRLVASGPPLRSFSESRAAHRSKPVSSRNERALVLSSTANQARARAQRASSNPARRRPRRRTSTKPSSTTCAGTRASARRCGSGRPITTPRASTSSPSRCPPARSPTTSSSRSRSPRSERRASLKTPKMARWAPAWTRLELSTAPPPPRPITSSPGHSLSSGAHPQPSPL